MREVWRIAYAVLHDAFDGEPPVDRIALFRRVEPESRRLVAKMIERDFNAPRAHGVGRYFDAFGALGLTRPISSYEGQVAIAWDFAAEGHRAEAYPFGIDRDESPMQVDLRPAVRAAVADIESGKAPGAISARFHRTIADATRTVIESLQTEIERVPVALTGGVFHNARLVTIIEQELSKNYEVLRHRQVPPGDGGIAIGQALIADAFLGDKD